MAIKRIDYFNEEFPISYKIINSDAKESILFLHGLWGEVTKGWDYWEAGLCGRKGEGRILNFILLLDFGPGFLGKLGPKIGVLGKVL